MTSKVLYCSMAMIVFFALVSPRLPGQTTGDTVLSSDRMQTTQEQF